jgi:hypothetical protein
MVWVPLFVVGNDSTEDSAAFFAGVSPDEFAGSWSVFGVDSMAVFNRSVRSYFNLLYVA